MVSSPTSGLTSSSGTSRPTWGTMNETASLDLREPLGLPKIIGLTAAQRNPPGASSGLWEGQALLICPGSRLVWRPWRKPWRTLAKTTVPGLSWKWVKPRLPDLQFYTADPSDGCWSASTFLAFKTSPKSWFEAYVGKSPETPARRFCRLSWWRERGRSSGDLDSLANISNMDRSSFVLFYCIPGKVPNVLLLQRLFGSVLWRVD